MAKEKKETVNIYQTMAQSDEAQETSQQLSELEELKQHAEAPNIPGFMLLKPIGQGAYAQVWEAIQIRTRRFCAVKVFHHRGGVNWIFLQREAERLLKLDKHPNIVSLLDADFTTDPAYYVMDLAQEGSLEKMIKERHPSDISQEEIDRIVGWMEEIANALQYVHSKHMIHCDLKPANVLLDDEGHTRVADFGHSRVLSESGSGLGTLFYMAPEQAVMPDLEHPLQPDIRWDIYAYGCTVYALLSGHVAHAEIGPDLERTPIIIDRLNIYRKAIQNDPVPDLFTLTKGKIDRDLSAIVEKCMKANPEERYRSITDVLKDLKNRREGKPVSPLAHIPSYWAGKFIQRYRVTLLVALIALIGVMAATFFAQQRQQSEVANNAFDDILRGREFLDKDDQASAVLFFAESNKVYPTALARGDVNLNMPPIPVEVLPQESELKGLTFSRDGQGFLAASENGVKFYDLDGKELRALKTNKTLKAFALSSEGDLTAAGDASGEIKILSLKTGKISTLSLDSNVTALTFSPDEKYLFAAGDDGTAKVFDTATGQAQHNVINAGVPIVKAVFNNESKRVLTLNQEGLVRIWDAEGASAQGDPMTIATKGAPSWYSPDIAYSRDGRTILTSDWNGSINFFDRDGHRQAKIYLDGTAAHFALDPSGTKLASSSISQGAGQAKIWTLKGRRPSKFTLKHNARILTLSFNRDGRAVITAGADRVARVWDSNTGKPLALSFWHGDAVGFAALNNKGDMALTGGKDGLARLWDLKQSGPDQVSLEWKRSGHPSLNKVQTKALISPDGKKALTYGGGSALLWDASTGKSISSLLSPVQEALFSPNSAQLLTGGSDQAKLWDLTASDSKTLPVKGAVKTLAFSPEGSIAAAGAEKMVQVWDVSSSKPLGEPVACGFKPLSISLSVKGKGLLALGPSGALAYFKLPAKTGDKPVLQMKKGVQTAVLSSDNRFIAASINGAIGLYDTSSGKPRDKSLKQDSAISLLALSSDNKTLVSLDSNGEGQLWNLDTASTQGSPLRHQGKAKLARFSPKGGGLAVAYNDDGLQFWDAKSGEPIGVETQLGGFLALDFLPGGEGLIWINKKGDVRAIDTAWLGSDSDPKRLLLQAQVAGQSSLSGRNSVDPIDSSDWYKLWKQYERR